MSNADTLYDQGSGMRVSQRSSLILSRLPPQMTRQLFASASKHAAKAGEALFVAGDRGDGCYRVEQGLVKITVTSDRGEERIIALVGAGEIIGELSLIDHQPRSASAIALCDSTFRYITRQAFEDCTKDDPETYKDLVAILAARLRETDEALAAASFLSVRGCVARTLLERTHSARPADQREGPGCHGRGGARECQSRLERFEEARGHRATFAILRAQRYRSTGARGAPLSVGRQGCMLGRCIFAWRAATT